VKERYESEVLVLGAGVSGLTLAHDLARAGLDVRLIDRADEVGGCAQTVRQDGFQFEKGPFNLLVRDPLFEDLLVELGDSLEVLPPSPQAKRRDLIFRGKRRKLPGSLLEAATTPLLNPLQKLRILLEPILGRRPATDDPTLGELFRRRFGNAFAERILSAAVVGIFGGDSERLSARSCFSFFWEIDRDSSSFLIGGIKRRLNSRMNTRRWKGMVSFEGGVGAFCHALAEPLGDSLHLSTEALSVQRAEGTYLVEASGPNGQPFEFQAKNLVFGMDLPSALRHLRSLSPEIVAELEPVESVGLAVVNLGFGPDAFSEPPQGFGFLVPATERGVNILGTLFASSVFPPQAPEGCHALRVFVGGVRSPEWLDLPEEELVDRSLLELSRFVEIKEAPRTVFVSRYKEAVPQFYPGHSDRIERVERLLQAHPGLYLVGNYLHGVSVNDCVVNCRRTARRVTEDVSES
jgi:oxygen-dependent protoporphyrinogen oxidase